MNNMKKTFIDTCATKLVVASGFSLLDYSSQVTSGVTADRAIIDCTDAGMFGLQDLNKYPS